MEGDRQRATERRLALKRRIRNLREMIREEENERAGDRSRLDRLRHQLEKAMRELY